MTIFQLTKYGNSQSGILDAFLMCIRRENCNFLTVQYRGSSVHTLTENDKSLVTIKRNQYSFIPHKPFYE